MPQPSGLPLNDDDDPLSVEVRFETDQLGEADLETRIIAAVRQAAASRGATTGSIDVLICDDTMIRELNVQHLGHDYATDVISFGYEFRPPTVEGELVASADTARREALESGHDPWRELLLYVVHGTLHVCGMADHEATERAEMRLLERRVFESLGVPFPAEVDPATTGGVS